MDGAVKLNLLSFEKRRVITDYEPKSTRFTGKLCRHCNTLYSDKIAFDEHQLACVAIDDSQENKEAVQSITIGAEITLPQTEEEKYLNDVELIKCEMCSERFSTVWKCKDHMKNVHLGHLFNNMSKLSASIHVNTHHQGKGGSSLICEVCEKKFQSRRLCEEHMRVHTGEKPYQCDHCGKNFRIFQSLELHERTHTGERPFKCVDCLKAFKSRSAVLRHTKEVHLKEKPYECNYCSKAFGQKIVMQQHVQTVHLKQPWKYISKSRLLRKLKNASAHVQNCKQQEQVEVECVYNSDFEV